MLKKLLLTILLLTCMALAAPDKMLMRVGQNPVTQTKYLYFRVPESKGNLVVGWPEELVSYLNEEEFLVNPKPGNPKIGPLVIYSEDGTSVYEFLIPELDLNVGVGGPQLGNTDRSEHASH